MSSLVGKKVKVLEDRGRVREICSKNENLTEWCEKRANCCGKEATILEEDEDDWTLQLQFDDGFESWFPRTAVTNPDGSLIHVRLDEKELALLTKTLHVKRLRTTDGKWESLGLKTGIGGKHWTVIEEVKLGSAGERAGLKAGMTLSMVNGKSIADGGWPKFVETLNKAGGTFSITVHLGEQAPAVEKPAAPPPKPAEADDDDDSDAPAAGPMPMPQAGPAAPTPEVLAAAKRKKADEEAAAAHKAMEEAARTRSRQATIAALAQSLMRRFGNKETGRMSMEGLANFFDIIGNPAPTRHEFRQCCSYAKGDAKKGLGADFLVDLLTGLPEEEEMELEEVARELGGNVDGPTWEPPVLEDHVVKRMADERRKWQKTCPRCGNAVGSQACPRGLVDCAAPPRAVVIGDSHSRELSELLANYLNNQGEYAFRVDAAPIVGASAQGLINPNSRTRARQKYLEAVTSRGGDGSTHIDYLFVMIGSVDFDSVMFHKRDKRDRSWWYPQQLKASANAVEKFLTRDIDFGRVWKVVLVGIHPPPVERKDFFEQLNKANHRNDEKDAGERLGAFSAESLPELSERTQQASLFNQELSRIVMEVNKSSAIAKETESRACYLSVWEHLLDAQSGTVKAEFRRPNRTDTHLRFDALAEPYANALRKQLQMECMTPEHYAAVEQGIAGDDPMADSIETPSEIAASNPPAFNPWGPAPPGPESAEPPAAKRPRQELKPAIADELD
eukprot:TRINITY_DN43051_c0_g1_i1.p1 TRINITY_DN43051_c0_g1~~TRINITY_DN43051_c0_g1_i1.p1  ORF type:complete len:754 (+),score=313.95 TRINITY_DN43051_c0_g1_i1:71-2263(+)